MRLVKALPLMAVKNHNMKIQLLEKLSRMTKAERHLCEVIIVLLEIAIIVTALNLLL